MKRIVFILLIRIIRGNYFIIQKYYGAGGIDIARYQNSLFFSVAFSPVSAYVGSALLGEVLITTILFILSGMIIPYFLVAAAGGEDRVYVKREEIEIGDVENDSLLAHLAFWFSFVIFYLVSLKMVFVV
ncbi:hypothetical protein [Ferrimonas marina]|uniref:hypothetical protein n=1 Tax=Ferrimonas marina TaxID=299255 RepID=UPI000829F4A8|nr:hypothetical protein [Ferrimonas marina]